MKLFAKRKDGGPESTVTGYFLIEVKWLFTVVLLRFDSGSRDAFHSHAFNCISWILKGALLEENLDDSFEFHVPSLKPVVTRRTTFHKVFGWTPTTWVLSFRGPWRDRWEEFLPDRGFIELTHGRKEVV